MRDSGDDCVVYNLGPSFFERNGRRYNSIDASTLFEVPVGEDTVRVLALSPQMAAYGAARVIKQRDGESVEVGPLVALPVENGDHLKYQPEFQVPVIYRAEPQSS